MSQAEHAMESMNKWLSHPGELGRPPFKLEIVREFPYDGMTYYLMRFKTKRWRGKWYIGICGGYSQGSEQHCGHVFSEMQEYSADTALDEAVKMIEFLKDYWKSRAESIEETKASEEETPAIVSDAPTVSVSPEQRCFVSEQALETESSLKLCYREEPLFLGDSGWRFLSGKETPEYLSDLSHIQCVSLTVMYYLHGGILPFLESPYGASVIRREDGSFEPEE